MFKRLAFFPNSEGTGNGMMIIMKKKFGSVTVCARTHTEYLMTMAILITMVQKMEGVYNDYISWGLTVIEWWLIFSMGKDCKKYERRSRIYSKFRYL